MIFLKTNKGNCNLIFECLKFLFWRFYPLSIQRKFPRKLCNSIINIDVTNIFKVFLLLFLKLSNSHFIKIKRVQRFIKRVIFKWYSRKWIMKISLRYIPCSGIPRWIVHNLLDGKVSCLVFVLQIVELLFEDLLRRICICGVVYQIFKVSVMVVAKIYRGHNSGC